MYRDRGRFIAQFIETDVLSLRNHRAGGLKGTSTFRSSPEKISNMAKALRILS